MSDFGGSGTVASRGGKAFALSRHSSRESIAEFGYSLDVLLMLRGVAERLAQRGDVYREVRLCHETVGPDFPLQFVFCYKLAISFNQGQQNVKRLRCERNGLACTPQGVIRGVKAEAVEFIKHLSSQWHRPFWRKFATLLQIFDCPFRTVRIDSRRFGL